MRKLVTTLDLLIVVIVIIAILIVFATIYGVNKKIKKIQFPAQTTITTINDKWDMND